MKRPKSHVIENISEDVFKSFLPDEWIIRKIPKDYGIDYEIEIVENQRVTGKRIWVQLKGTEKLEIKSKSVSIPLSFQEDFKGKTSIEVNYIPFQASTNLLKYALLCDFPLILGVVDVKEKNVYWIPIQDEISENIENNNFNWRNQKSVVLHIPVRNNLKDNLDLYGLKWYSMEPARMRAFAILHAYHHELGYRARLSGYEIGDGYIDQKEELKESIIVAKKYLILSLEQSSLFGKNGLDVYIITIMPFIVEGIEACTEILEQIEKNVVSFIPTSILIGKVDNAVNLLSTCIAMYQDFRKKFLQTDEKTIFTALMEIN
jgi:hypothetical protein